VKLVSPFAIVGGFVLFTGDDDEVISTRNLDITPITTHQNLQW